MKGNRLLLVLAAALTSAASGCGDNSKECGPGTTDVNGVCTGDGGELQCTGGTILDAASNSCVIDPNACQDGTVLVGDACVDPGRVTTDITEAAEPNGLGLFGEDSTDPAGEIVIKPVGENFVLSGKIAPFQDLDNDGQLDPDVDTYLVEVNGPTLVNVSADGLHGLAAGFIAIAAVGDGNPLADWQRFGINLTGDMSQRQLYLPAAGLYALAVTDSRTLFTGAAAGAPSGGLDFEYYVTLSQITATPTALTVTDGEASATGELAPGEVKLFTVPMGEGINVAELDVPSDLATESVLIVNTSGATTTIKALADGGETTPAVASVLGIRAGDTTLVVVDHVLNFASSPVDFDLLITTGSAGALSDSGADVSQPASSTDFTAFHYDVATNLEITGMDLAFDVPVTGVVVDENFFIFANFTFDPFFGFQFLDTFTEYKGLLRHRTAGRYYFLVFDPDDSVTDIVATSTYAPVATTAITLGTPLTNEAPNAFESNPYTYLAGTSAWQLFDATGTSTGNLTQLFLDPAETTPGDVGYGFGRLDSLDSGCTIGATDFCADITPIFVQTNPAAGTTAGRILLDDAPFLGGRNYLVTVNTATVAGATFDLDYQVRAHTDLGTVAVGTPVTADDQPLELATDVQRYLVKTASGNGLSVVVTPDAGTPALDTRIQLLNTNESTRGPLVNNGGLGDPDTLLEIQSGAGWTAFRVTTSTPSVGGTFDLSATASAPVTYTGVAGTTAFVDACTAGTPVVMSDLDEGASVANIATPTGFTHFGFASPQLKMFANGFVSFDTSTACASVGGSCFFTNTDIPVAGAPNSIAAPFWDDLDLDLVGGACQATSGTKLILQWRGIDFNTDEVVAFQLILDGADSSYEFVYDATHEPTGARATVGIENQNGTQAAKVGFNTAGTVTPGASRKLTPN